MIEHYVILGLMVVIVWFCRRMARLHDYLSILNECISDMLVQPRAAEAIAKATREELIRKGHVEP